MRRKTITISAPQWCSLDKNTLLVCHSFITSISPIPSVPSTHSATSCFPVVHNPYPWIKSISVLKLFPVEMKKTSSPLLTLEERCLRNVPYSWSSFPHFPFTAQSKPIQAGFCSEPSTQTALTHPTGLHITKCSIFQISSYRASTLCLPLLTITYSWNSPWHQIITFPFSCSQLWPSVSFTKVLSVFSLSARFSQGSSFGPLFCLPMNSPWAVTLILTVLTNTLS